MEVCWEDAGGEMELMMELETIEGVIVWEETMEEVIMMEIEYTTYCCCCRCDDDVDDGSDGDCCRMECVDSSGDVVMVDESLYNKYRLLLSDLAGSFMDWEEVTGDAIMVPAM